MKSVWCGCGVWGEGCLFFSISYNYKRDSGRWPHFSFFCYLLSSPTW